MSWWLIPPANTADGFVGRGAPRARKVAQFIVSGRLAAKLQRIRKQLKKQHMDPHVARVFAANPAAKHVMFAVSCRRGRLNIWASEPSVPGVPIRVLPGRLYGSCIFDKVEVREYRVRARSGIRCRSNCSDSLVWARVLRAMGIHI